MRYSEHLQQSSSGRYQVQGCKQRRCYQRPGPFSYRRNLNPQIVYDSDQPNTRTLISTFQGNAKTSRLIGGSNFIPGSGDGSMGNILSNYQVIGLLTTPIKTPSAPIKSRNANNTQESTWWLRYEHASVKERS